MNAETKTEAAPEAASSDIFETLINKAVSRIERAATPQVQPMELRSFDELERWAKRAAASDMVPKDYKGKPDNIILAVQMGSELGLRPMQSLQNIMTNNGRPSVWGDAMLALCKMHPAYISNTETVSGEGDNRVAKCVTLRRGEKPVERTFSVADAKKAGLWGKNVWAQYPDRMLQMRARGFALRDAFPDKLKGLVSAEEAQDYQAESAAPPPEPEVHYAPVEFRPPPKKTTTAEWLASFKLAADACEGMQDYEELCEKPDVKKMDGWLTNGAKEQFETIKGMTLDRLTGMDIVSQQMET